MNLPKRIRQHQIESESFAILLYKLRKVGIFRNLTDNDYGIDFEIEQVRDGRVTGKYIKAQVKGFDKVRIRRKDKKPVISGIKQSTLYYWAEMSFNVNVIVFAIDVKTENIYMTKPIFWQAISLLDKTDQSKTIEFLPIHENHSEIVSIFTSAYSVAPCMSEFIHTHINAIRNLSNFLELYWGVFWYDQIYPVMDADIFREFLVTCKSLFWEHCNLKIELSKVDRENLFNFNYWSQKDGHGEPFNYICKTPMGALMPIYLEKLGKLRELIEHSFYYWNHKNQSYLQLVYCNPVSQDMIDKTIKKQSFEYREKYQKSEIEFLKYRVTKEKEL